MNKENPLEDFTSVIIRLRVAAGPAEDVFWIVVLLEVEQDRCCFEYFKVVSVWVYECGDTAVCCSQRIDTWC